MQEDTCRKTNWDIYMDTHVDTCTIRGTYLDVQEEYRQTHWDIYMNKHMDTNMNRVYGEDTDSQKMHEHY